ncbi:MAG TPA: cob(I)yrinic acid a,c-diamide adenosyltransferase [Gemmatimonadales bacterium]|nr:cob(I)yrinic acid a,c-diamide adenosyltransferase [Gemmatimonadales bacterium]
MAKIYTKSGDRGETGLFGGGRVPKDHLRVEAYGQVDELNAAIGLARALDPPGFHDGLLQTIQRDLFTIGAQLATPDPDMLAKTVSRSGAPIGESEVGALEHVIDAAEATLEPLKSFILPGGTAKAGALHVARTACRRAERAVVALARAEPVSPAILQYLNRLSDLLFVLARAANAHAGRPDIKW